MSGRPARLSRAWWRKAPEDAPASTVDTHARHTPPQRGVSLERVAEIASRIRGRIKRGGVAALVMPDGNYRTLPVRDVVAEIVFAECGSVLVARADLISADTRCTAQRRGVELVEVSAE